MAPPARKTRRAKQLERYAPYKSGLEFKIARILEDAGRTVVYEREKLEYVVPSTKHKYTPDFKLKKQVYIEGKGRLLPSERKKHILLKEQHPDVEIMFFFDNAQKPIYKGSKTTYADWADKHGFKWTDLKSGMPEEWLK